MCVVLSCSNEWCCSLLTCDGIILNWVGCFHAHEVGWLAMSHGNSFCWILWLYQQKTPDTGVPSKFSSNWYLGLVKNGIPWYRLLIQEKVSNSSHFTSLSKCSYDRFFTQFLIYHQATSNPQSLPPGGKVEMDEESAKKKSEPNFLDSTTSLCTSRTCQTQFLDPPTIHPVCKMGRRALESKIGIVHFLCSVHIDKNWRSMERRWHFMKNSPTFLINTVRDNKNKQI